MNAGHEERHHCSQTVSLADDLCEGQCQTLKEKEILPNTQIVTEINNCEVLGLLAAHTEECNCLCINISLDICKLNSMNAGVVCALSCPTEIC